jgi:hypothetical protein
MVVINKVISSAVCLASLAAATPRLTHHSGSSQNDGSMYTGGWPHTNPPPGNSPTPPGNLPVAPDTNPTNPPSGSPPPAGSPIPSREFAAEYYNIFPQHPDLSDSPVGGLHLEAYEGINQRETIAVFNGIPPEARQCRFGWASHGPDDRVFIAKLKIIEGGSSDLRVSARQLSGFPEDGVVSWNSILPLDNVPVQAISQSDFLGWDSPTFERPGGISGTDLVCAENMYLKIGFVEPDSDKHIYLMSDIASGVYIQYLI